MGDAASTYSAAADHFDELPFWDRIGRRTVDRLALQAGESVLDACCGTGASALPAAHAVGPGGRVVGLDLAEPALARARAKAREQGLRNVEFTGYRSTIERVGVDAAARIRADNLAWIRTHGVCEVETNVVAKRWP